MQHWDSEGQIYIKMLASDEFFTSSTPQHRMFFQELARYETGRYEKAIATLELALDMFAAFLVSTNTKHLPKEN